MRPLGLGPGLFAVILIAAVRTLQHANFTRVSLAPADFCDHLRRSSKPQALRVLHISSLSLSPHPLSLVAARSSPPAPSRGWPSSSAFTFHPASALYVPSLPVPFISRLHSPHEQLPPEIEYKDQGYVARAVVFALMCLGCFLGLLMWIGEVIVLLLQIPALVLEFTVLTLLQWAAHKVVCKPI